MGCSNTSSSKPTETKEQKENTTIQLKGKDIQEIRLDSSKKDSHSKSMTDNEELIKAIKTSIETGTTEEITLDKKTKDTIHANMTVTLKDDSKEEYLVWINNKNKITIAKDTEKKHVQGILINNKDSKLINNFFANKNSLD
ncbi:hypothetical protein CN984_29195 [Bacillus cereus]|uniref:Lipoprotein n=1 Tax=Bacillus cereus TaxID=1396 RepID=A0A2B9PDP9_BACCE|nr:hypothetical protein CN984_29195 [Bacillus cereus]